MVFKVVHKTAYIYHEPISLCHNMARLIPRSNHQQLCIKSTVNIDPIPDVIDEFEDFFGNKVIYFAIQREHKSLLVTVSSEIERLSFEDNQQHLIQQYGKTPWEEARMQLYQPILEYIDARQYVPETAATSFDGGITEYALQSFKSGRSIYDAVYN